jgi:hypothetical protein
MTIRSYIHLLVEDYKGHVSVVGYPGAPYICWLTDEYMGPHVRSAPGPIAWYIRRCHITDEYIVKFVSTNE